MTPFLNHVNVSHDHENVSLVYVGGSHDRENVFPVYASGRLNYVGGSHDHKNVFPVYVSGALIHENVFPDHVSGSPDHVNVFHDHENVFLDHETLTLVYEEAVLREGTGFFRRISFRSVHEKQLHHHKPKLPVRETGKQNQGGVPLFIPAYWMRKGKKNKKTPFLCRHLFEKVRNGLPHHAIKGFRIVNGHAGIHDDLAMPGVYAGHLVTVHQSVFVRLEESRIVDFLLRAL